MNTSSSKHRDVRNRLEAAIQAGEFAPGEQLPAEQDLAQRFGVSYMTARRAVSELVAAEYLERRSRKGTFVRHQSRDKMSKVTLNLITSAYEGEHNKSFLRCGVQIAQSQGWNTNVIRLTTGQQDPAVRVIRNGELAIVMLDEIRPASSLSLAMRASKGKAISFHRNLSDVGVPTIKSDPKRDMHLAVDHLQKAGHQHIALVTQFPSEANDENMVPWQKEKREVLSEFGESLGLIPVKTPLFYSPMRNTYGAVFDYLNEHPQTTALITTSDEIAVGALAACRNCGRPVPDSMSLVSMGDSPLAEFLVPPVTCVDFNFENQFEIAVEILKCTLLGTEIGEKLRLVTSHLVERESVAPVPHA